MNIGNLKTAVTPKTWQDDHLPQVAYFVVICHLAPSKQMIMSSYCLCSNQECREFGLEATPETIEPIVVSACCVQQDESRVPSPFDFNVLFSRATTVRHRKTTTRTPRPDDSWLLVYSERSVERLCGWMVFVRRADIVPNKDDHHSAGSELMSLHTFLQQARWRTRSYLAVFVTSS